MKYSFLRKQAANILTFINMILGLVAILLSIQDNYRLSCIFITVAGLTDYLDGWVARKLNTTSAIGKFLDSNSDLISFGLAPGLLIYLSVLQQFGIIGIAVSFIYIICGAFRLARFNAVEFTGYYTGVPITISGTVLALSIFAIPYVHAIVFIGITLILAYLMISTHSIKKI
jgi:CDP-diacylglycerol--serine O-phosphatidyltransferase